MAQVREFLIHHFMFQCNQIVAFVKLSGLEDFPSIDQNLTVHRYQISQFGIDWNVACCFVSAAKQLGQKLYLIKTETCIYPIDFPNAI